MDFIKEILTHLATVKVWCNGFKIQKSMSDLKKVAVTVESCNNHSKNFRGGDLDISQAFLQKLFT